MTAHERRRNDRMKRGAVQDYPWPARDDRHPAGGHHGHCV